MMEKFWAAMMSVPPRGSGWVIESLIVDYGFQMYVSPKANRQSAIGNRQSVDPPATAWWC